MAERLTELTVDEFVRKVLAGERDFTNTSLAPDTDLAKNEAYPELVAYLQEQDLRNSPVVADGADWRGLRAPRLMITAKLAGANLTGADLRDAEVTRSDLSGASLEGADLRGANLSVSRCMKANLTGARLQRADLYEVNFGDALLRNVDLTGAIALKVALRGTDLTDAIFTDVDLYRADLRGALGLESTVDLGSAHFHHTIVTPREHAIVNGFLQARPLFDIKEE
jgi:uncharacterized protein YjbI with pentapeptide repeats